MNCSPVIVPTVATGWVSRQTNLGVSTYDLDELYSPDSELWKSKVLDLVSPKYQPQKAANPTQYIFDRSRYNNHGTITGATWVQLPSGLWCLSFDGSDDTVSVSDADSLDVSQVTLMCWVRLTTTVANMPNGTAYLLTKTDGTGAGHVYLMELEKSTGLFYFTINGSYSASYDVSGWAANEWHHLACTYNLVNRITYNNGVSVASDAYSTAMRVNTSSVEISRTGGRLAGNIALAKIFNTALTAGQVERRFYHTKHLVGR